MSQTRVRGERPTMVMNWPIATLTTANTFFWVPKRTTIFKKFMHTNREFLSLAKANNYRITPTGLRDFDLTEIRPLVDCGGLEGMVTNNGTPILSIVDPKIRSKMAREYVRIKDESDDGLAEHEFQSASKRGRKKASPLTSVVIHNYGRGHSSRTNDEVLTPRVKSASPDRNMTNKHSDQLASVNAEIARLTELKRTLEDGQSPVETSGHVKTAPRSQKLARSESLLRGRSMSGALNDNNRNLGYAVEKGKQGQNNLKGYNIAHIYDDPKSSSKSRYSYSHDYNSWDDISPPPSPPSSTPDIDSPRLAGGYDGPSSAKTEGRSDDEMIAIFDQINDTLQYYLRKYETARKKEDAAEHKWKLFLIDALSGIDIVEADEAEAEGTKVKAKSEERVSWME